MQDLSFRESEVHRFGQELVDDLEQPPAAGVFLELDPGPGDEHAAAGPIVDDTVALELGIRPRHGVGVDHQVARELAHRGQLLVGPQVAPGHCLADLLHQLLVNRQPAGTLYSKLHGTLAVTVLVVLIQLATR